MEITINRRNGFDGTGRIGRTVDLIAVGSDTEATAEGRFGVSARPASRFHGQSACLGAGRPGRPFGPLTVTGAVGHLVAVAHTAASCVQRRRLVAPPLTAVAPVALRAFSFVVAVRPLVPVAPASVNCPFPKYLLLIL